jgi:hypothetical protein
VSTADVVARLRSPEGEEWSRSRALAEDEPVVYLQVLWRATGPLDAGSDPCGRPPASVIREGGQVHARAVRTATQ